MIEVRRYIALLNGAKALALRLPPFQVAEPSLYVKLDTYPEPSPDERFKIYARTKMRKARKR